MNAKITLHKLRLVTAFALIGSVLTGVFFGSADLSFDPRIIGVGLGAVLGSVMALTEQ